MSSSSMLHPEVLWAQRTDEIYFTINLTDIKDPELEVTKDKISFKGKGGAEQKLYGFELDLYNEINPESSKRSQTGRHIFLVLDKAEHGQSYWPRLTREKIRLAFLKTDFAKWKDEDEEESGDPAQDALGGMDFSSLMSDMDSDDTDEEIPNLETVTDQTKVNVTEPMAVEEQKPKEAQESDKTEKEAEKEEKTETKEQ
ncbi:9604_t:CDS:2 [Ambispora gerdemannii]|uniref:9604_t:CDS:1 n=1 Tax=Ambispora gerdemannii TaxID=144530 RepID=A0A9N8UZ89_9GLOM|nr:9604_t:CDS:2 [Ambispora gerdemannii]